MTQELTDARNSLREAHADARALAVKGEQFLAVGDESEVMRVRGTDTQVVSAHACRPPACVVNLLYGSGRTSFEGQPNWLMTPQIAARLGRVARRLLRAPSKTGAASAGDAEREIKTGSMFTGRSPDFH
jgi:hypothetical protein